MYLTTAENYSIQNTIIYFISEFRNVLSTHKLLLPAFYDSSVKVLQETHNNCIVEIIYCVMVKFKKSFTVLKTNHQPLKNL